MNDAAFSLFREVELCIRDNLTAALASREGGTTLKEQIFSAAMSDQDVQHFWTLLTGDLNKDEASDLLREIIQQWITIRGFSIAGHWMELYKSVKFKTTSKLKPLRRAL